MQYRQNRAAFPLEAHSAPPVLRAGRMDRSGRPEGDNDLVEQYRNPSKELALLWHPDGKPHPWFTNDFAVRAWAAALNVPTVT